MPAKKEKRSDGRYQVSLTLGRKADGTPNKKYFYGKTQREANQKKKEYLDSIQSGVSSDPTLLSSWISTWLESSSQAEGVRYSNHLYAQKVSKALGNLPIKDIRMIDIRRFAQDMSRYSFSTVKKVKGVTNKIFEDAVRNRMIPFNPCSGVSWEYAGKGTHRALEDWEKALILENHQVHRAGRWALLMLFAGLRRGEALALNWDDVDFENNVIHVVKALRFSSNQAHLSTTKTKAGIREVPLLPQLKDALLCYGHRTGRICLNAEGNPIETQSAFERGWESYLNAMENILNGESPENKGRRTDLMTGLDRKTFSIRTHDLRHTFCTMLYNAGIGLKEAQYIMGHADPEMTLKVYTHLDAKKRLSAASILTAYKENFDAIQ